MTATVRVFKSTDASAPTLSGAAGALITVLDAVLVNGYGSTTPAGWTKAYSGTNLASYYMGAGTPRMYLAIDDTGAQEARAVGYETMSAVSTGTGPFPTAAQVSGGLFIRKSAAASGTARPWLIIACERALYIFISSTDTVYGSTTNASETSFFFGCFVSYKSGDAYQCGINGAIATGASQGRIGNASASAASQAAQSSPGMYVARAFTQVAGAINVAKQVPGTTTTASAYFPMGAAMGSSYPDPITGGMRLTRVLLTENDGSGLNSERGYLPGLWCPMHNLAGSFFDTFDGLGALAGKSFILPPAVAANGAGAVLPARVALETTGSWDL